MVTAAESAASRRTFLLASGAAAMTAIGRPASGQQQDPGKSVPSNDQPFGHNDEADSKRITSAITSATIAEAEKLASVTFTADERAMIAQTIGENIERFRSRRSVSLPNALAPAQTFDPRPPGFVSMPGPGKMVRSDRSLTPLPADDVDIAFAPVTQLSRWIERRDLTSERLTRIYLDRLKRFGPKLECVVTLTADLALAQAKQADQEIAAGKYRGPLHGIPWGAKDLFDTKGITTTWGATPYKDRVPADDAYVVRKLDEAGAVLVAKLTLGALAYGDIWFGGRTNNPWNVKQGSSGSSAGSAAATVAGLVGFALGTETYGSIVSPSMRCGATGLRPTFGRVARSGAMALCSSLDKIGPICRSVEDCALVLHAINGSDPGDPSSIDMPFAFDAHESVRNMRVGYDPTWFEGRGANDIDRAALNAARAAGVQLLEIELPDWPYDALLSILLVEAASAFEELTLDDRDDELVWQDPDAWPNAFRKTRFTPAIEYVQAERFRRKCMDMMAERFAQVEAIISPSFAGSLLLITNNTGHPSLTIRAGFRSPDQDEQDTDTGALRLPHGITLWGRLYEEERLCNLGMELENKLGVSDARPDLSG